MFVIRGVHFIETDDYDIIQSAYESYLYGEHRGLDTNLKEYGEFYLCNYLYEDMLDVDNFKRKFCNY